MNVSRISLPEGILLTCLLWNSLLLTCLQKVDSISYELVAVLVFCCYWCFHMA